MNARFEIYIVMFKVKSHTEMAYGEVDIELHEF
jgi:hypothetical protein